ncbi:MAG: hypothetical protein EBY22_05785 [Gammaproteobacteria bacterium]|nr:hypothetical protein [Gammaproteobacteria bacterium]
MTSMNAIFAYPSGSGHYGVPGVNLLIACLHLHHEGILKSTCHIMNPDTGEDDITVQDLLDNPKYDLLRGEYQHCLLRNKLTQ